MLSKSLTCRHFDPWEEAGEIKTPSVLTDAMRRVRKVAKSIVVVIGIDRVEDAFSTSTDRPIRSGPMN